MLIYFPLYQFYESNRSLVHVCNKELSYKPLRITKDEQLSCDDWNRANTGFSQHVLVRVSYVPDSVPTHDLGPVTRKSRIDLSLDSVFCVLVANFFAHVLAWLAFLLLLHETHFL